LVALTANGSTTICIVFSNCARVRVNVKACGAMFGATVTDALTDASVPST
jgi:hypothetical protein